LKDLKGFARFLSRAAAREPDERSDTHYHQHAKADLIILFYYHATFLPQKATSIYRKTHLLKS